MIPAVIAYLATTMIISFAEIYLLKQTHQLVMSKVYHDIESKDLEIPLYPANSLFFAQARLLLFLKPYSRLESYMWILSKTRIAVVLGLPAIVEIYAYAQLISRHGIRNPLVLISLAATIVLGVNALVVLLGTYKSEFA